MKTNILKAIINLINNQTGNLKQYNNLSEYNIRINNMGVSLEEAIKDSLSGYNGIGQNRLACHNYTFSYLGNQNNPPDLIIEGGDAIEIKKIESNEGNIALNSSYPKDKLYKNSPMLTNACKNCEENWIEKDICYVIGCIDKETKDIKSLWFIYGDCYSAKPEIYTRIKDNITNAIEELGIESTETNEIAKVKKTDPLGVTDLRVRGMWSIQHPSKVFGYVTQKPDRPYIKAIMLKSKFESFDEYSKDKISSIAKVQAIKIKDPNNPAKLLHAVLIEYQY